MPLVAPDAITAAAGGGDAPVEHGTEPGQLRRDLRRIGPVGDPCLLRGREVRQLEEKVLAHRLLGDVPLGADSVQLMGHRMKHAVAAAAGLEGPQALGGEGAVEGVPPLLVGGRTRFRGGPGPPFSRRMDQFVSFPRYQLRVAEAGLQSGQLVCRGLGIGVVVSGEIPGRLSSDQGGRSGIGRGRKDDGQGLVMGHRRIGLAQGEILRLVSRCVIRHARAIFRRDGNRRPPAGGFAPRDGLLMVLQLAGAHPAQGFAPGKTLGGGAFGGRDGVVGRNRRGGVVRRDVRGGQSGRSLGGERCAGWRKRSRAGGRSRGLQPDDRRCRRRSRRECGGDGSRGGGERSVGRDDGRWFGRRRSAAGRRGDQDRGRRIRRGGRRRSNGGRWWRVAGGAGRRRRWEWGGKGRAGRASGGSHGGLVEARGGGRLRALPELAQRVGVGGDGEVDHASGDGGPGEDAHRQERLVRREHVPPRLLEGLAEAGRRVRFGPDGLSRSGRVADGLEHGWKILGGGEARSAGFSGKKGPTIRGDPRGSAVGLVSGPPPGAG